MAAHNNWMSSKQKLDIPHNKGLVLTACFHDSLGKLVLGQTILDCTAAKDDGVTSLRGSGDWVTGRTWSERFVGGAGFNSPASR